jgi:hypothetical protein
MRYNEIKATENITTVKKESQLLKWLANISSYLDTFGDNYLLYRTFSTGILRDKRPLTKVNNVTHTPKKTTTANNKFQELVLKKLEIENPVFCYLKPPENTKGSADPHMKTQFLGNPYILIPPREYEMFWSPVVYDLGKFYINAPTPRPGNDILNPEKIEDYVDTYQKGWPTRSFESFTENEIILDARYYYILNIESVISIIDREIIGDWGNIDKERYLESLTTYSDLSDFIKNNIEKIKKQSAQSMKRAIGSEKRIKSSIRRNKNYILKQVTPVVQSIEKNATADELSAILLQAGFDNFIETDQDQELLINILKSMGFKNADLVQLQ